MNLVLRGLKLRAASQGPPLEGAHSPVGPDAQSLGVPTPDPEKVCVVARQFRVACLSQLLGDSPEEKNGSLLRGLEYVKVSLLPA